MPIHNAQKFSALIIKTETEKLEFIFSKVLKKNTLCTHRDLYILNGKIAKI